MFHHHGAGVRTRPEGSSVYVLAAGTVPAIIWENLRYPGHHKYRNTVKQYDDIVDKRHLYSEMERGRLLYEEILADKNSTGLPSVLLQITALIPSNGRWWTMICGDDIVSRLNP